MSKRLLPLAAMEKILKTAGAERVSDKAKAALKMVVEEIADDICNNLNTLLELADLVKFAKWHPLPDENESSMQIAYDFVLKTKLVPVLRKSDSESADTAEKESIGKEAGDVQ